MIETVMVVQMVSLALLTLVVLVCAIFVEYPTFSYHGSMLIWVSVLALASFVVFYIL